jgi:hypothetical protein
VGVILLWVGVFPRESLNPVGAALPAAGWLDCLPRASGRPPGGGSRPSRCRLLLGRPSCRPERDSCLSPAASCPRQQLFVAG